MPDCVEGKYTVYTVPHWLAEAVCQLVEGYGSPTYSIDPVPQGDMSKYYDLVFGSLTSDRFEELETVLQHLAIPFDYELDGAFTKPGKGYQRCSYGRPDGSAEAVQRFFTHDDEAETLNRLVYATQNLDADDALTAIHREIEQTRALWCPIEKAEFRPEVTLFEAIRYDYGPVIKACIERGVSLDYAFSRLSECSLSIDRVTDAHAKSLLREALAERTLATEKPTSYARPPRPTV